MAIPKHANDAHSGVKTSLFTGGGDLLVRGTCMDELFAKGLKTIKNSQLRSFL